MINVTIWNEFRHERSHAAVQKIYPKGMHVVLAEALKKRDLTIRTATLDEKEHGLSQAVLDSTDVLVWWGHMAHGEVKDEIAERVCKRVLAGMGLVVLHSGHFSKVFKKLMGTGCDLKWRESTDTERIWTVNPGHPIAQGVPERFEIPEEMYGEHFDIPAPDELIFISWFTGGEVFRSGCTWTRGNGKVFYFRPGHETYPSYKNKHVLRVIANGIRWAAPGGNPMPIRGNHKPLEALAAPNPEERL
jgi:trehalose utilization protein